nr:hypothetical protein [Tanacetum cinerariifolium]GEZ77357.1 hypothetical protein [Tanacetum cinerariifolium]
STNEKEAFRHVGYGAGAHGRFREAFWYYSHGGKVHRKGEMGWAHFGGKNSWDLDKVTWEGRVEVYGTIPVVVRYTDSRRANVQCYNCNARGHYAHDCPKPKVRAAKYTREQMLLAMTDEIEGTLNDEKNDFVLYNSYGDETLEELIVAVIMMARIQQADDNAETDPKYDVEAVSEVNASHIDLISGILSKGVHEHTKHEKLKTIINTSNDDQIDSNIIFDDTYVENNGRTVKHASNAHDPSFDIESLVYNVQKEAKNQ